ncbi:hypothetical protein Bhyg_13665 [Pseudolycoriella hygida]|uniref:Ska2 N-terminal domain-containing protein n=1 Tax=Pseudolycoriella hygida TaxID=35572 RepID=A0A9Q0RWK1_9DIPT|nr:hypothetical protein Bhyg_13665 [Pseudolycoriella hygida]
MDFTSIEKSVACAGSSIDAATLKLTEVENSMIAGDEVDTESVMELLESMTEVKNEYQNLRKDLKEVQQLQKEMTTTLIYQRQAMLHTFRMLKKRLELKANQN